MFENIGDKIKSLAVIVCIIGIIASVIMGVSLLANEIYLGLVYIVVGVLISWIGSFGMYGFGELIEKTASNNELLVKIEKHLADAGRGEKAQGNAGGQRAFDLSGSGQARHAEKKAVSVPAEPVEPKALQPVDPKSVRNDLIEKIRGCESARAVMICMEDAMKAGGDDPDMMSFARLMQGYIDRENRGEAGVKHSAVSMGIAFVKGGMKVHRIDGSKPMDSCPACGCSQNTERRVCFKCGVLLMPQDD